MPLRNRRRCARPEWILLAARPMSNLSLQGRLSALWTYRGLRARNGRARFRGRYLGSALGGFGAITQSAGSGFFSSTRSFFAGDAGAAAGVPRIRVRHVPVRRVVAWNDFVDLMLRPQTMFATGGPMKKVSFPRDTLPS